MVKTKMYIFYWLDDNETIFNTSLPRFYYVYTFMGTAVKNSLPWKKSIATNFERNEKYT